MCDTHAAVSSYKRNQVLGFVELVEEMRLAQRQYFRSRQPVDLQSSKSLERQVDRAAKQLRGEIVEQQGQQSLW